MNYVITFAMLTIFVSCKNDSYRKKHNYTITQYQRVEDGYKYSKDLFIHHSNTYRPVVSSACVNDTLVSVWVFKTEGKIKYSGTDIKADTLLFQMLNIPHKRSVEIRESELIDNGKVTQITEMIEDSIYSVQEESLFLYTTNETPK